MIGVCVEGRDPVQPVIQTVDAESAGVSFSLWAMDSVILRYHVS